MINEAYNFSQNQLQPPYRKRKLNELEAQDEDGFQEEGFHHFNPNQMTTEGDTISQCATTYCSPACDDNNKNYNRRHKGPTSMFPSQQIITFRIRDCELKIARSVLKKCSAGGSPFFQQILEDRERSVIELPPLRSPEALSIILKWLSSCFEEQFSIEHFSLPLLEELLAETAYYQLTELHSIVQNKLSNHSQNLSKTELLNDAQLDYYEDFEMRQKCLAIAQSYGDEFTLDADF